MAAFLCVVIKYLKGEIMAQVNNGTNKLNKIRVLAKKHKKPLIIIGAVYLVLMVGVLAWVTTAPFSNSNKNDSSSSYTPPEDKYPRVDVNGLTVSEACTKLKEKGWKVESVYGSSEDYKDNEVSDCSNSVGKVNNVNYYGGSVSLYYSFKSNSGATSSQSQQSMPSHSDDEYITSCSKAIIDKFGDPSKKGAEYAYKYEKWVLEDKDGSKLVRSDFSMLNDDKKLGVDPNGPEYYYGTSSCKIDSSMKATDVKQDFKNL